MYGRLFGCLMDEVEKPLAEYASLGEFFTRKLKPGSRAVRSFPLFLLYFILLIFFFFLFFFFSLDRR